MLWTRTLNSSDAIWVTIDSYAKEYLCPSMTNLKDILKVKS